MTRPARRRLVLHIGQTKTGSTAIQNYLEGQRSALAREGVLFPSSGFSRGNPFNQERTSGHLSMVRSIAAGRTSDLEQELSESDAGTLLISAENLFLDRPRMELEALREFFKHDEIAIVLVFRDPLEWAKSIYVEEVLSGYFCRTETFEEFIKEKLKDGSLDYARRIALLDAILQPKTWHLVNYEKISREKGVIDAFLDAAGIPCTNPMLATSLRANVREKEEFLIEGKRRLNHALFPLPLTSKLELENALRQASREICGGLPQPVPLFSDKHVPLSITACEAIQASNTKLVEKHGLPDPFPVPMPYDERPNWRKLRGASDLFAVGLKAAAQECVSDSTEAVMRDPAEATSNPLSVAGSTLIVDLLQQVTVSWHVASPKTPMWAAAYPNKLPILLSGTLDRAELKQLLTLNLPSHVICLDTLKMIKEVVPNHTPEALIVSPMISIDTVKEVWAASGGSSILALMGHDSESVVTIANQLKLKIKASYGDTYLLDAVDETPRDCTRLPRYVETEDKVLRS